MQHIIQTNPAVEQKKNVKLSVSKASFDFSSPTDVSLIPHFQLFYTNLKSGNLYCPITVVLLLIITVLYCVNTKTQCIKMTQKWESFGGSTRTCLALYKYVPQNT